MGIEFKGIDILEIESGNLIQHISFPSHIYVPDYFPIIVEFSPDSSLLAVGNAEEKGDIMLVRIEDGSTLTTLKGHTYNITDLEFSKDGLWLVSCSDDGTIRFWGIP